jgi:hypothetical protein
VWYQYVTGDQINSIAGGSPPVNLISQNIDSVMLYTPLQVQAIQEQVFRSRYNALNMPFAAWPEAMTTPILQTVLTVSPYAPYPAPPPDPDGWISGYTTAPPQSIYQQNFMPSGETFIPPLLQPGIGILLNPPGTQPLGTEPSIPTPPSYIQPTIWDHLIFAYLLELTGVVEIFRAIIEKAAFGGDLGQLTAPSLQFLRTTEWLLFSDPFPTSILTSGTRFGRNDDEMRITYYRGMFGADLPHKPEREALPWPADSYRDFFPTLERMLRQVWRGIANARNIAAENEADPTDIAIQAQNLSYTLLNLRFSGRYAREEFTAVSKLAWLGLALYTNNFLIQDMQCEASDQAGRLENLAMRVNMKPHLQSRHLFNLAQPLSYLLQSIETSYLNVPANAQLLYSPLVANPLEANAETVIDEYSAASGVDLKAKAVSMTDRTKAAPAPRAAPRIPPPHALPAAGTVHHTGTAPRRGNGAVAH